MARTKSRKLNYAQYVAYGKRVRKLKPFFKERGMQAKAAAALGRKPCEVSAVLGYMIVSEGVLTELELFKALYQREKARRQRAQKSLMLTEPIENQETPQRRCPAQRVLTCDLTRKEQSAPFSISL